MEFINLEQRLIKFDRLQNLKNYEISGIKGKIRFFKNKKEIASISYQSEDTFKVLNYNLNNINDIAPLILFLESTTYSQDKDLFFSFKNLDSMNLFNYEEFENYLKKIEYEINTIDNEKGLYLDLTEFENYNLRLDYLRNEEKFKRFIK